MTDAGYVAGGYAVTVVAIGSYVVHMWVRSRTVAKLVPPSQVPSGQIPGPPGGPDPDQNGGGLAPPPGGVRP